VVQLSVEMAPSCGMVHYQAAAKDYSQLRLGRVCVGDGNVAHWEARKRPQEARSGGRRWKSHYYQPGGEVLGAFEDQNRYIARTE
jgi:hypothetical protein